MPKFYVTTVTDCERCNGTGAGTAGPARDLTPEEMAAAGASVNWYEVKAVQP